MQSRGSKATLSGMAFRSRVPTLLLSMFATFASIYVAGRLWQDAQNRVYLIKELDKITGQGQSAISVDDTLKIIACREQLKKLSALEMELAAARQEGFTSKHSTETTENNDTKSKKRPLVVIGILTKFGRNKNRDAIRKAWMGTGAALKKMENEKGIIVRFVNGRSANRGDQFDRAIDDENRKTNDFIILDNHMEAPEEFPKKAKLFFAYAADKWDAEFYAKVNDDVYVNIAENFDDVVPVVIKVLDGTCIFIYGKTASGKHLQCSVPNALGATLATHLDKPRVYIGCMKSGEVFFEPGHKWYEPDWWKFGDKRSYFRHASGEMYVISQALAKFISINRSILRTYAHDDVSAGSWFIGLDVKHVNEGKLCCSSWSAGAICAGV